MKTTIVLLLALVCFCVYALADEVSVLSENKPYVEQESDIDLGAYYKNKIKNYVKKNKQQVESDLNAADIFAGIDSKFNEFRTRFGWTTPSPPAPQEPAEQPSEEQPVEEADINWKKTLNKVGKHAVTAGKLVANAHGIPLEDELYEQESDLSAADIFAGIDSKFNEFRTRFGWTTPSPPAPQEPVEQPSEEHPVEEADRTPIKPIKKSMGPKKFKKNPKRADKKVQEESDISFDDILDALKKAEKIREILKEQQEVESDSMIGAGVTLKATTAVNVRNGACTNKGVIRTLSPGETVRTTGWSGSDCGYLWYGVQGSFGYGYVAANFVQQVGGGPSPSPSPSPAPAPSGGGLSLAQLRAIMPNLSSAKANEYIGHLNNAMNWAAITTCRRRSAFLAQLAHESAQLRYMEEIADGSAYEGRRDLGNTQPGDGRRYKGRGPIQLTGRANYRSAGRDLGVDLEGNPTIAATPQWGFKIAAWYWKTRSLNGLADEGTQGAFDQITRRINGGYNGKADRDRYWASAKRVLGC